MASPEWRVYFGGVPPLEASLQISRTISLRTHTARIVSVRISALVFGAGICSRNFAFDGSYSNVCRRIRRVWKKSWPWKNDHAMEWWYSLPGTDYERVFSSDAGVHSAIVSQPQAIMCGWVWRHANLASDIIGKRLLSRWRKLYLVRCPMRHTWPPIVYNSNYL